MDAKPPPPLFAAMDIVGNVGFFTEELAFNSAKKSSAFDLAFGCCSLAFVSSPPVSCTRFDGFWAREIKCCVVQVGIVVLYHKVRMPIFEGRDTRSRSFAVNFWSQVHAHTWLRNYRLLCIHVLLLSSLDQPGCRACILILIAQANSTSLTLSSYLCLWLLLPLLFLLSRCLGAWNGPLCLDKKQIHYRANGARLTFWSTRFIQLLIFQIFVIVIIVVVPFLARPTARIYRY